MESAQVIAMRNWCNVRLIRHWPAVVPKRDCCITVIEEANTRGLAYQAYLEQSGIQSSMSRKGNCMEVYYNHIRRHSTLGYVSPLVYEQVGNQQT